MTTLLRSRLLALARRLVALAALLARLRGRRLGRRAPAFLHARDLGAGAGGRFVREDRFVCVVPAARRDREDDQESHEYSTSTFSGLSHWRSDSSSRSSRLTFQPSPRRICTLAVP